MSRKLRYGLIAFMMILLVILWLGSTGVEQAVYFSAILSIACNVLYID